MKTKIGISALVALLASVGFGYAQEACSDEGAYRSGLLGEEEPQDCKSGNYESYKAAYDRGAADRGNADFLEQIGVVKE